MNILQVFKTFSNIKTLRLYLSAIPIRAYKRIDGWLSLNEAYHLYVGAQSLPANATVVEIGSWKGKSTYCLAKGLRSGTVYAIDPFNSDGEEGSKQVYEKKAANEDLLNEFKTNMSATGVSKNVVPKKGYSKDFINEFKKIDFLFIDGDHSIEGAKFDFESYSPMLAKGGLIAFHDYDSVRNQLGPWVVIESIIKKSGNYEEVGVYDTLWMGRKIK
ncbi:MAG TPA: class I SAM-dependent methyltransferase [Cyclobacteriaceae bacterium]|nr:class I SAM-dependent methyltransferase [Cyclobacteriaceae bacterium]